MALKFQIGEKVIYHSPRNGEDYNATVLGYNEGYYLVEYEKYDVWAHPDSESKFKIERTNTKVHNLKAVEKFSDGLDNWD